MLPTEMPVLNIQSVGGLSEAHINIMLLRKTCTFNKCN